MDTTKLDTRHLEKSIEAHSKEVLKLSDTVKNLGRTVELLIRQLERVNTTLGTANELKRHSAAPSAQK